MLLAEYDYDTDIAIQRAEASRIAFAEGIQQGFADGSYRKALETAKIMLERNYPPAEICLMTGLSKSEIEKL